jgi:hypothetical protein
MQATRALPCVVAFIASSFEKRTKLRVSNDPEHQGFRNSISCRSEERVPERTG